MYVLSLILLILSLAAQAPLTKRVTYEDDVKPVFQRHCLTCHSAAQMTAGLNLETYPGVLKGGGSGEIVTPGRAASRLVCCTR
jgi:hypothetical protein